jgi:D-inositol-3-phosphate glycosyltransferase
LPGTKQKAVLVLVGSGPEEDRLKALAKQLQVGDQVLWLGARPPGDLPAIYQAADMLLHPSQIESFSMACLEAMSYGKPIVCFDSIGLVEFIHPAQDSIVIQGDRAETFTAAVRSLVADPLRRQTVGRAAAKTAQELQWRHVTALTERQYRYARDHRQAA